MAAIHTPVVRLGMRGTGSFDANVRPKNWRETLLRQYPNGAAPLTAMLAKLRRERTDDAEFNWLEKELAQKAGNINGVYTDAGCAAAVGDNTSAAGTTLYIKFTTASDAKWVREGNQVILVDKSHYIVFVNAKVMSVDVNTGVLQVKLLKADTSDATYGLTTADRLLVASDINPEGGAMPEPIVTSPTKIYNYTQINRTSIFFTRTAKKTRLRTKDDYAEAKREAFEMHAIDREWNYLFGTRSENLASNDQYERTTMGVREFISTYASANIADYRYDTDYSTYTWLQKGDDWLTSILEDYYVYAPATMNTKLALCGHGALRGLSDLAKHYGYEPITPMQAEYGVSVKRFVTSFGDLYLLPHPLFNREEIMRNSIIVLELPNLVERFIDDTFYKSDDTERKGGSNALDGTQEEWLTEAGLELHWANTFLWLSGVGQDNLV